MNENLEYIAETLEDLSHDLPSKPKTKITELITSFQKMSEELETNDILKIQDEIEFISNMANVDSLTRIELSNIISDLEGLL